MGDHVAPLSVDLSQVCSTLSALRRTTRIRLSTSSPFGPRLGPRNSAVPAEIFPSTKAWARPSLSTNNPRQPWSPELYAKIFSPRWPFPPSQLSVITQLSSESETVLVALGALPGDEIAQSPTQKS